MNKKSVLILAFLLVLFCFQHQRFQQDGVRASDGYPVHNLNTGLNYATIQEAIFANETLDGHVIHVDAGTYNVDDGVLINKSISLVGDGRENTTIIGTAFSAIFYVTADHVTISGFTMRNGEYGVEASPNFNFLPIKEPDYVHILNCNISDNKCGIEMYNDYSPSPMLVGEIIEGNILMNNTEGAMMNLGICNSVICHNFLSDNGAGIYLSPGAGLQDTPTGNLVYGNTIINSSRAQRLTAGCMVGGGGNRIFLNNFVNNTLQADSPVGLNTWNSRLGPDDLLWGGNYWSDYAETNSYGKGTSPYVICANNTDHYPLTGMVNFFDAAFGYDVAVVSNSSISDFEFNLTSQSQAALTFNVAGENGTAGFCWVIIPQALMNYSQTWSVKLDGELWSTNEYSAISNQTHWNFWINYSHSIHQIEITGVTTVPEFPTFLVLPLLMITTLLVMTVYRRRHHTRERARVTLGDAFVYGTHCAR